MNETSQQLAQTPLVPRYSPKEENDLRWWHGPGQATFEHSPFGGMLDRASSLAMNVPWPRVPVLNKAGACIGWESGVTAFPTAEVRQVSGYMPDEELITRAALVNKNMLRVERADPNAAAIIALFFGDSGERWSKDPKHGRVGALYHLTQRGKKLIEAAETAPNAIELTAADRIESICIVNASQPKEERTTALAVCSREAAKLERHARAVWHAVKAISTSARASLSQPAV